MAFSPPFQRPFSATFDRRAAAAAVFSPVTIIGCSLWLDATVITGKSDGDTVETWPDSSGAGRNVTQSDAAQRPLYYASVIGGKPILRWNASKSGMTVAVVQTSASYTIAAVVKHASAATGDRCFVNNGSGSTGYGLTARATNRAVFHPGQAFLVDAALTTNAEIWVAERASGTVRFWLKTAEQSITNGTANITTPAGSLSVGSEDVATRRYNGDVAELVVYDNAIGDANRLLLTAYLAAKYGL